ncbi:MAG: NAD(+) synthase, partial [Planctomycetes bacterium]|nr:NAD(+) synthase [Planctomycetota bacterium]
EMCRLWGFDMETLPIGPVVAAATGLLPPGLQQLTLENMQARARGYLLMTVSNDRNWLLLSTGNKSEIAVGYATLYGDMCGGYNPLKDVFKTTVFALARWRNRARPTGLLGPAGVVIPPAIIERPPSAELAPGQKDTDSLPPYPVLDAILEDLVEKQLPVADIAAKGFDRALVDRVYRLLKRAEYKRRQGAPGPKTTYRAFARDRRMPIVNGFDPDMTDNLRRLAEEG